MNNNANIAMCESQIMECPTDDNIGSTPRCVEKEA